MYQVKTREHDVYGGLDGNMCLTVGGVVKGVDGVASAPQ